MVAFKLVLVAVVDIKAGDVHLYLGRTHPHFQQKLVQVDVLRPDCVGVGVVADEVELELHHPQHGRLQHVLEEHPFLGVHHLVVAVLQHEVAVDVLDVEVGVEAEPFLIFTLILQLSGCKRTPFSPRFSSSGSNSSWMFSSS